MAISHVFAEGVGPFKSVHLDLRGPDGKPSLGPHILAGVNGSGKSTLLKAIAWCMANQEDAFPIDEWIHLLRGQTESRVLLVFDVDLLWKYAIAATTDTEGGWDRRLAKWVRENVASVGLSKADFPLTQQWDQSFESELDDKGWVRIAYPPSQRREARRFNVARFGGPQDWLGKTIQNAAAYSSARSIRYIAKPDMALPREKVHTKRFGFELTVQNEAIQSWLLGLYSKRAIANERKEPSSRYTASLEALQRGLKRICGNEVSVVVDIEPTFQPRLRIGSQTLNFSQIPDGLKVTFGWLADFLMRAETDDWAPEGADLRTGILLFDEIEGFLHPLWQRRLLPALREALPTTQSIVTSHSPFVISSCPGSMIHVLKLNSDGTAYAEPPMPAPIGESITSTLKDIFGVESRFDIETEEQLAEWNDLKKVRSRRKLDDAEEHRFQNLSEVLGSRSEELRSLVTMIPELPKVTVDSLAGMSAARRSKKSSLVSR